MYFIASSFLEWSTPRRTAAGRKDSSTVTAPRGGASRYRVSVDCGEGGPELLERGEPGARLLEAVVPERPRPAGRGGLADLLVGGAAEREAAERVVQEHELVDADLAAVATVAAFAADGAEAWSLVVSCLVRLRLVALAAVHAQPAHEPLRDHRG